MRREKVVHVVTPTAPLAPDLEQNSTFCALGFGRSVAYVLNSVTFRIVFGDRVVRSLRAQGLREAEDGCDGNQCHECEVS
jgi:hypothetical protein